MFTSERNIYYRRIKSALTSGRYVWVRSSVIVCCTALVTALLFNLFTSESQAASFLRPANLQKEARVAAAEKAVLVVLYERSDCPYCRKVKNKYLQPLTKDTTQPVRIIEIHSDSDRELTGFSGQRTTERQIAAEAGVKMVPVVSFVDENGKMLAKPIVGALLDDFYNYYLSQGITSSACALGYQSC